MSSNFSSFLDLIPVVTFSSDIFPSLMALATPGLAIGIFLYSSVQSLRLIEMSSMNIFPEPPFTAPVTKHQPYPY